MDTALYFPSPGVPLNSWLTQVILYWDEAASIDLNYTGKHNHSDLEIPYRAELYEAGLLRSIKLIDVLQEDTSQDEAFLAMLDTEPSLRAYEREGVFLYLPPDNISPYLLQGLRDRGLADGKDYDDFALEWNPFNLVISYLIGSLCRTDPTLFPVTDKGHLAALGLPDDDSSRKIAILRQTVIAEALPVPSGLVPARELAWFKEKHGDQLHRLQIYLNDRMADLALLEDNVIRKAKVDSILQEIHDDVSVLHEQMSRRNWPNLAFAGVGGIVASALAIGTAIAAGGDPLTLGLGISGGVASIGPAAYQVADLLRSSKPGSRSPLAYAALAQDLQADSGTDIKR